MTQPFARLFRGTSRLIGLSPRTKRRRPRAEASLLLGGLAVGLLAGCGSRFEFVDLAGPGQAVELSVAGKKLVAEIAADSNARRVGLMYRQPEELPQDHGMLFVMPERRTLSFHMRNTIIPLSIAFVKDDGEILQIEEMKPKDESTTESKDELRIALEVHQGWFRDNGIKVGDRIENLGEVLASVRAQ